MPPNKSLQGDAAHVGQVYAGGIFSVAQKIRAGSDAASPLNSTVRPSHGFLYVVPSARNLASPEQRIHARTGGVLASGLHEIRCAAGAGCSFVRDCTDFRKSRRAVTRACVQGRRGDLVRILLGLPHNPFERAAPPASATSWACVLGYSACARRRCRSRSVPPARFRSFACVTFRLKPNKSLQRTRPTSAQFVQAIARCCTKTCASPRARR